MKKKLIIILIVLMFSCFNVLVVSAQTSTESTEANLTPTVTQTDNKKVREIRDQLQNQVQKKIQERIEEIKKTGVKRAYVGDITSINGLEIILITKQGERKVTVDEEAIIVNAQRKEIGLEDLEVNQTIICMGQTDSENGMIAKRIVTVPKPSSPPVIRRAIFGEVVEVNEEKLTLVLTHLAKEEVNFQIETNSKTKITKKIDGEIGKVQFSEVEVGDHVATIGVWDPKEEILTAKLLRIIPR